MLRPPSGVCVSEGCTCASGEISALRRTPDPIFSHPSPPPHIPPPRLVRWVCRRGSIITQSRPSSRPVSRGVTSVPAVAKLTSEDRVIGTLLAGVLASLSREPKFEGPLVHEGTVEALVLLMRHTTGAGGGSDVSSGAHVRPSCAQALYNLSCSKDAAVWSRVAEGGVAWSSACKLCVFAAMCIPGLVSRACVVAAWAPCGADVMLTRC
jgi:hypothetical protein